MVEACEKSILIRDKSIQIDTTVRIDTSLCVRSAIAGIIRFGNLISVSVEALLARESRIRIIQPMTPALCEHMAIPVDGVTQVQIEARLASPLAGVAIAISRQVLRIPVVVQSDFETGRIVATDPLLKRRGGGSY